MKDPLGYEGRRVVVTGAASGMGAEAAKILLDLGAQVVALDVKPTELEGVEAHIVDLRDPASIAAVTEAVGGPVGGLIGSAGLPGPPFSDLDTVLVNFVGGRALIEGMLSNMTDDAGVVMVASNAGLGWQQNLEAIMPLVTSEGFEGGKAWLEANPGAYAGNGYAFSKQVTNAYVAWKGATLISTGVRINCVNPGPTQTAMMPFFEEATGAKLIDAFIGPVGRRSLPVEQAWAMVMMASPRLSYVNGEALHVDGGFLGAMSTGQIDIEAAMAEAFG